MENGGAEAIRDRLTVPDVGGSLEALADGFLRSKAPATATTFCDPLHWLPPPLPAHLLPLDLLRGCAPRARRRIRETCICEWPI